MLQMLQISKQGLEARTKWCPPILQLLHAHAILVRAHVKANPSLEP